MNTINNQSAPIITLPSERLKITLIFWMAMAMGFSLVTATLFFHPDLQETDGIWILQAIFGGALLFSVINTTRVVMCNDPATMDKMPLHSEDAERLIRYVKDAGAQDALSPFKAEHGQITYANVNRFLSECRAEALQRDRASLGV